MPVTIIELFDFLADLLFPRRCAVCDSVLPVLVPGQDIRVCPDCIRELRYIREPYCMKCGKPLARDTAEYCNDCRTKVRSFSAGRAVFLYRGRMKDSMYRFKYAGRREYASFFAEEACRLQGEWIRRIRPELIIPVPMHPAKKRKRGYNQAEDFAVALGKKLRIPVRTDLVRRVRNTVPMKGLSERERRQNMVRAFAAAETRLDEIAATRILVVDDIYTTGSTIQAVTRILTDGRHIKVWFLCICIGQDS